MNNPIVVPALAQAPIQPSLFAPTRLPDPTSEQIAAMLAAHTVALDVEVETDPAKGIALGYPGQPSRDYGLSYCAPISFLALAWQDEHTHAMHSLVFQAPFTQAALDCIQALLTTDSYTLVGHGVNYDIRALGKHTLFAGTQVWDTAVMARLLTPELGKFDLLTVAENAGIVIPGHIRAMKKKRATLSSEEPDKVITYVAWDALTAYEVYTKQLASIDSSELYELAQWEVQASAEFSRMGARGMRLNVPYTQERIKHLITERQRIWRLLVADGLANPGSTQKRAEYIYGVKAVPLPAYKPLSPLFTDNGAKRAEAGEPITIKDMSTSGDALRVIIETNPDAATTLKLLIDFQRVEYMCNALEALLEHASIDGRVHTQIGVAATTGRRISSNPNLQNLPFNADPDDIAGAMAGIFIADEGYTFVEIDLTGAELLASAMIAGDDAFAAAFAASDMHSAFAAGYFGERWEKADKDERKRLRRMSKTVTFAGSYGAGAKKIAQQINVSEQEAKEILAERDRVYWATAEAKQAAQTKARQVGYVNSWTGRRIPVDPNYLYTAWDFCCQSAVAELTKRAIVLISAKYRELGLRSYIAIDVHDSIILAVKHGEWNTAIPLASQIMSTVIPDELNERTTPKIRWQAEPDFESNAKKWGYLQYHPEPAPEIELPTLPDQQVTEQPEIIFTVPSLGFTWRGRVRLQPEIRFSDWSPTERVEAVRFFCDYLGHIYGMLNQVYEVYLPARLADGSVGLAEKPTGVDLVNWAKIPLLWAKVAAQGVDTVALIEMNQEALIAEAEARQAQVNSIQRLSDTLLEYLAKLPSEKHEEGTEVIF